MRTDYENLLVVVEDGVATITVHRPDKLNALDTATLKELDQAFGEAGAEEAVRVVILTGSGPKAFVAGADIAELSELGPVTAREHALFGQAILNRIEHLEKPVIAAVNGFALGGGCELAMACTLRIASAKARFGQPEAKLGLIPGFGGTQRLTRLVGKGRALEMILTGEMIDAAEAHRIGLVNRVVPPEEVLATAVALARAIQERGPVAVRYSLIAVNRGAEVPLPEAQRIEADLFGVIAATEDCREGTRAFLEKREPRFVNR